MKIFHYDVFWPFWVIKLCKNLIVGPDNYLEKSFVPQQHNRQDKYIDEHMQWVEYNDLITYLCPSYASNAKFEYFR